MRLTLVFIWGLTLFCIPGTFAQNTEDTLNVSIENTYIRQYEVGIAPNYDLRNVSVNGLTVYCALQDAYTYGLRPLLPEKLGKILGGIWSFAATYMAMIWPHEFGHYFRAKQVGGEFKIHNGALPFPYTTMHLPENVSHESSALSVTGGFEINYLTSDHIQTRFYENNGAYNDELALSFVHQMMYPIYSALVVRTNPKEKDTWINTAGDPVHIALPVWQMYSNENVFLADSSVNPGLVKYFNQSTIFGSFWSFADPAFYKQIAALAGDSKDGKKPWYLIGNQTNGWSYGTMFNTSPLGYELYLKNYLKLRDKLYVVYFKYGMPFSNYGIGFNSPNLFTHKNLKIGVNIDLWSQDIYNAGISGCTDIHYDFKNNIGIHIQAGYKTKGYVIGRQLDRGLIGFAGIKYKLRG